MKVITLLDSPYHFRVTIPSTYSMMAGVSCPSPKMLILYLVCTNSLANIYQIIGSDPKNTKAVQLPQRMIAVGQKFTFTIQARNKNGLNASQGGDEFLIACSGPAELTVGDYLFNKEEKEEKKGCTRNVHTIGREH